MKRILIGVFLLFICVAVKANKDNNQVDYYEKHVVILVDQTPDVQNHQDMHKLYIDIRNLLLNDKLQYGKNEFNDFTFNPQTDELSLYAFGLAGNRTGFSRHGGNGDNPYKRIGTMCNKDESSEAVVNEIINQLIHKRGSFHSSGSSDIKSFIDKDLYSLFHGKDPLYDQINNMSGITMSRFVYPAILDARKIDVSTPTKEYYFIIVTNFQSGMTAKSDIGDVTRLKELTHYDKYINAFRDKMDAMSSPFYQVNHLKLRLGNKQQDPIAEGFYLRLLSLENTQVYITSNMQLTETDYNKTTYDIDDVSIAFNHDESLLSVDKLVLKISEEDGGPIVYNKEVSFNYNDKDKTYSILSDEIDLGKVYKEGKVLKIEYIFYTTAKDKSGEAMMPLVFVADRDYEFSQSDIISITQAKSHVIGMIVLIILIVVILVSLGILIFIRRGRKRKVNLDFSIWPIRPTRFMDVKDKKVISYDCWYWKNGERDANIYVTGQVDLARIPFAKRYSYKVEYCILDVDTDLAFSFRPDTHELEKDGSLRKAGTYYEAPIDDEGRFHFNVNAYVDTQVSPEVDFNQDHILCTKVIIKVIMKDTNTVVSNGEKRYKFIVKPAIENSNSWVAFDPGTSGSCVAFGATARPTSTDDIYLAEEEIDTISDEKKLEKIYPSKIYINPDSKGIFGGKSIVAEELREGVKGDFLFGTKAEMRSDSAANNIFQSIKKLLGYTTPQTVVSETGAHVEIAGRDLAHMLVCGLYNHFETYMLKEMKGNKSIYDMFVNAGKLNPQRAIVAVPNNYTLVKIQEMVDSVKRMGKFCEVHYIYESEAVLMSYFRKNWANLQKMQDHIFIVFDMGGATINATAFQIHVHMESHQSNEYIRSVDVKTIAKIGYGVGGDDIDYAIIQVIYNIPSIRSEFDSDSAIAEHQKKHKSTLIKMARQLKLDYIDKMNGQDNISNRLLDNQSLYSYISSVFSGFGCELGELTEEDKWYLDNEFEERTQIKKFVLDNVYDAVKELLVSMKVKHGNIELIMSGRSVLYPGIKENVLSAIKDNGYHCSSPWNGFMNADGTNFNDEAVKTAVAIGACWYAMYSSYINMEHNIVTSTFGYIDTINNKEKFIPIIMKNMNFNENGEIESDAEPKTLTLNDVQFIQMLGSNYDEIWDRDIRHKMNKLDEVRPSQITTKINKIIVKIDNKGNFSYEICLVGSDTPITIENNKYSRLKDNSGVLTEITDENSDAYSFAISNVIVEPTSNTHIGGRKKVRF